MSDPHKIFATPSSTAEIVQFPATPGIGHNVAPAPILTDPLASLTKRQIFFACIWLADISTALKLFLLCIGRFFDEDARASSMSYKQVARECGLHESSAKRLAYEARNEWLKVEVGKGQPTASGRQNLYHGICPPNVVGDLRNQLRESAQGVSVCDPDGQGVAGDDPKGSPYETPNAGKGSPYETVGSHQATRTTLSLKEEREAEKGSPYETPHFNGAGFVISGRHGKVIPHETVERWRTDYPYLPKLNVKLEKLGGQILAKGPKHQGWSSPVPWIEDILATDNQRAEREAKLADEKLSRAKGPSGKRYTR